MRSVVGIATAALVAIACVSCKTQRNASIAENIQVEQNVEKEEHRKETWWEKFRMDSILVNVHFDKLEIDSDGSIKAEGAEVNCTAKGVSSDVGGESDETAKESEALSLTANRSGSESKHAAAISEPATQSTKRFAIAVTAITAVLAGWVYASITKKKK